MNGNTFSGITIQTKDRGAFLALDSLILSWNKLVTMVYFYPTYLKLISVSGQWASCTIVMTLTLGTLSISSFNLVAITVTRYISIRDPLKFSSRLTHRSACTGAAAIWIILYGLACGLYIRPHPPGK